jgi:hypothetical protein
MDGTNFALATSFLCLVLLSTSTRDVPARVVNGEACAPLVDDACKPIDNPLSDMTLSTMRLAITSLTDYSVVLNSSEIYTQDQYLVGIVIGYRVRVEKSLFTIHVVCGLKFIINKSFFHAWHDGISK